MHDDEMALLLEALAELATPFGGHIPPPPRQPSEASSTPETPCLSS